jgi:SNF2 family DNA or RNA helicase
VEEEEGGGGRGRRGGALCRGPHLIVCPASVVSNWARELATW